MSNNAKYTVTAIEAEVVHEVKRQADKRANTIENVKWAAQRALDEIAQGRTYSITKVDTQKIEAETELLSRLVNIAGGVLRNHPDVEAILALAASGQMRYSQLVLDTE